MIYIIIPVHNREHYTRGCLQCLSQQTYRDFTTIVVDDGSTDGTAAMIAEEYPKVIVLNGDGNLWWTKAINKGVLYALAHTSDVNVDVILTLNDDLTFDVDYIASVMKNYQANKPCLMGSVVVDSKNPTHLDYAGTSCNYYTAKTTHKAHLFDNNYQKLATKFSVLLTDDLPGRGTLIPLSIFSEIGLYDEHNFPHYMADIEFAVRARRAGYTLFVSVGSVIYNYMEATRNKRQSFGEFFSGFFSFKSPNYLKARYTFSVRHTPLKHLYFLLDLGRMVAGFSLKR